MISAPFPTDETERLAALVALQVLDTAPTPLFDALVRAAAQVCGVPISLISLVDAERQWFKANVGLDGVSQTPREVAFCAHTILGDGLFEVNDASADPRFADNPLVAAEPDIRFYAGAPLRLTSGATVGTLCVIDREPRQLTDHQRSVLQQLAVAAAQALESHRALQLQQQALAARERFRVLADTAPVGVFATDAAGQCTYTNGRWQAIHGLAADQALGDGWAAALHPQDAAHVAAVWHDAASHGEEVELDYRVRRPDGQVRLVHNRVSPVRREDGGLDGFVGCVNDVTELREAERALRTSERFLDRTGRVAGIGGWEYDVVARELFWSDQTCRLHGMPPGYRPTVEEAIAFYAPEARATVGAAVERAIADGTPWDLELPANTRDGRRMWVRAIGAAEREGARPEGRVVRLIGAFQDITERMQERLELERLHERITLATDSGGIGIFDLDLLSGELTWDRRMHRLYGLPETMPFVSRDLWLRLVHPDDRSRVDQASRETRAGRQPFDIEYRVIHADGSVHHLRSRARGHVDDAGRATRFVGVCWDVTAQRQLAAELAEQHELLRVTLESIGDAVITTDERGQVQWLNPVAERLTGWTSAEARGRPLPQVFHIVHEDTRQPAPDPVAACLDETRIVGLAQQTVLVSRHGIEYGIEDSAAPIRDKQGDVRGAVLVFHDVTEQRRLAGEMSWRAQHDSLTGLVNRSEFDGRLKRVLLKAQSDRSHHALLYIDLDQFKLVNDACGHSVGDQLLQQVSKVFSETVRSRDTLARLGGDEFAVILEHCNAEQAARVAQQICDRMEGFRFSHDGRRFRIGASIGLVPVDQRWHDTAAILKAADTACYAAKEAGRNRVHAWFDTDQTMRHRHGEMRWAQRLEQAIDDGHFELFAQVIEPLAGGDGRLHAEVLLRLREPGGELVTPGAFLGAAERFQLATRIDRWVLRAALAWLRQAPHLARMATLSVNLSGQSIGDRAFHRQALETLGAEAPEVLQRLCFEITETAAITNLADAAVFIEQVRALGVRIALDDFGAGASSFGYLKSLAVDYIKIDGQFVKDIIDDPLDDAAVRCFHDVARVVGVKTVAEFVDRPEVLARLQAIGIDFAQGFLLHRPAPLADLVRAPLPLTLG